MRAGLQGRIGLGFRCFKFGFLKVLGATAPGAGIVFGSQDEQRKLLTASSRGGLDAYRTCTRPAISRSELGISNQP